MNNECYFQPHMNPFSKKSSKVSKDIYILLGVLVISSLIILFYLQNNRPQQKTVKSNETPVQVESDPLFPKELIGKASAITEAWIEPVLLENKEECLVAPSPGVYGMGWDPKCKVMAEAIISKEDGIKAEIVANTNKSGTGKLRFLKNDSVLAIPTIEIDSNIEGAPDAVWVSYVDEHNIRVLIRDYDNYRELSLDNGQWITPGIPKNVLAAYPWDNKPPFYTELSKHYVKYVETRNPMLLNNSMMSLEAGYFGTDPYRSKWALVYTVDRATGEIVEQTVTERKR